ncbi:DUF6053 domain-containing protein [Lysobacter enzymogenes]|uniref:DUF6053 domain-containing protein n=1 Tax=Lysobacter enzymogenes TaxID=69 RepID=UPI003D2F5812
MAVVADCGRTTVPMLFCPLAAISHKGVGTEVPPTNPASEPHLPLQPDAQRALAPALLPQPLPFVEIFEALAAVLAQQVGQGQAQLRIVAAFPQRVGV